RVDREGQRRGQVLDRGVRTRRTGGGTGRERVLPVVDVLDPSTTRGEGGVDGAVGQRDGLGARTRSVAPNPVSPHLRADPVRHHDLKRGRALKEQTVLDIHDGHFDSRQDLADGGTVGGPRGTRQGDRGGAGDHVGDLLTVDLVRGGSQSATGERGRELRVAPDRQQVAGQAQARDTQAGVHEVRAGNLQAG